jgi:hypothetical protein
MGGRLEINSSHLELQFPQTNATSIHSFTRRLNHEFTECAWYQPCKFVFVIIRYFSADRSIRTSDYCVTAPAVHNDCCIYLSIYGSTALVDLGRFFSYLIYIQSVRLLGRGISSSQGFYLHTGQHKHRINGHRHPCLEWD